MKHSFGLGIVLIPLFWCSAICESVFIPSTPPSGPHMIPVIVSVREYDHGSSQVPVPDADVRLAFRLEYVSGSIQWITFWEKTDAKGECRFAINPSLYESLDWACEVEKHFPDGRILRDIELPAWGEIRHIYEEKDFLKFLKFTVIARDVSLDGWPVTIRTFDLAPTPFPEQLLDPELLDNPNSVPLLDSSLDLRNISTPSASFDPLPPN